MCGSHVKKHKAAWYLVMNGSAANQTIFHNEYYFELFLELLEETYHQYQVEIHAYCIMDNQYYLLLRVKYANLSETMRHLNGLFARRYNSMQDKNGPLFKGRYKAILLKDEKYCLLMSRFIHLNPVAAKLCLDPVHYPWSSYRHYLNLAPKEKPSWLFCNTLLEHFQPGNYFANYEQFVLERIQADLKVLPLKENKILALLKQECKISEEPILMLEANLNLSQTLKQETKNETLIRRTGAIFSRETGERIVEVNNARKTATNEKIETHLILMPKKMGATNLSQKIIRGRVLLLPETRFMTNKAKILMANKIIDIIANYYHIDPAEIRSNKYKSAANYPRKITIYLLSQLFHMEREMITHVIFDISKNSITKVCQRIKGEISYDENFQAEIDLIKTYLGKNLCL